MTEMNDETNQESAAQESAPVEQPPAETPAPSAEGEAAEAAAPERPRNPNMRWYIVHTYSGFEKKVK